MISSIKSKIDRDEFELDKEAWLKGEKIDASFE